MNIKLLVDGGSMKPGPAVAQQLGPMGINMGKVISEVNQKTQDFKGMKVPVLLDVDEKTKEFTITTFSPPASELLKKELGLEKGADLHEKIKVGNASIEDVIKITKTKHPNMLDKTFKNAVKSVLGTCASIGILVENKEANGLIQELDKFENEINQQKTETPEEKRQKLKEYYDNYKKAQEAKIKAEEATKEEAEAAKEAEKTETLSETPPETKESKEGSKETPKPEKPSEKPSDKKE